MKCTSVCIDLRGFSQFYQELENAGPFDREARLSIIEKFFLICEELAIELLNGESVDFLLTGDGAVVVFRDQENHYIHGYIFALIVRTRLNAFFQSDRIARQLSFGVGIASGRLEKMSFGTKLLGINFMSSAINTSARLEKLTKVFRSSELLISHTTLWPVFSRLSKEKLAELGCQNYKKLMERSSIAEKERDITTARKIWSLMQEINETYFFRFVSNYSLAGVEDSEIIYRFSRVLFETIGHELPPKLTPYFSSNAISLIAAEFELPAKYESKTEHTN